MLACACRWLPCVVFSLALSACGPAPRPDTGGDGDGGDAVACTEGVRQCDGNTFQVCSNGEWVVVDQCPLFCTVDGCTSCEGPGCMTDACAEASGDQSSLGCEYWAVDLDNATEVQGTPIPVAGMECALWPSTKIATGVRVCFDGSSGTAGMCDAPDDACPAGYTCMVPPMGICALDGDRSPFAIVVSNPNATLAAVTIAIATGQTMTVTVDPGAVRAIFPKDLGFPDQGLDGTGLGKRAYRVTSSIPVVAYQFNPLDDVDVFSNDASLLIPRAGFDKKYIAVSYPTLTRRGPSTPGRDHYNGFVAIVAWQDDTIVEVTATTATVAGRDGTPAMVAGQSRQFVLSAFDVLNLEAIGGVDPFTADGLNGGDLTGTVIQGLNGKSFGVFGGHEAVKISAPASNCCADHLEEMLFPTATWGKQFAVARTVPRRDAPDVLRVVASAPNTQITFSPPPAQGTCGTLPAGGHCDVLIIAPTEVTASEPVTVAHLMMSAIQFQDGTGDPSLGIVPPVEQHRTDYKFLAPMEYAEQWASIVAQAGDTVLLDGVPVGNFLAFGAGRASAWAPLTPGTHVVSCPAKCSVEVYGWSQAVSYLFAAGTNLKTIVIE